MRINNNEIYEAARLDASYLIRENMDLIEKSSSDCFRKILLHVNTEVAHFILLRFFGAEWVKKNFYGQFSFVNKDNFTDALLLPISQYYEPLYNKIRQRTWLLAESLFNLQEESNFEYQVRELKKRTENGSYSDLEGGIAEIFAARFLFLVGMPVEFVVRSSIKGNDFDLKSRLTNGESVGIEVKSSNGNFNYKSFLKKIRDAITQIEAGNKVVFFKIPEEWPSHQDFGKIFWLQYEQHRDQDLILDKTEILVFWEGQDEKSRYMDLFAILNYNRMVFNPLREYLLQGVSAVEKNPRYRTIASIANDVCKEEFLKFGIDGIH